MSRMTKTTNRSREGGFSIIELLMVIAILGLVVGAIHSLYGSHQRSATVETEVIDVQQNLRIGMEQMARDISMAGFLVTGANPVAAVVNNASPTADGLILNTATESLVAAAINASNSALVVAAGDLLDLPVMAFGNSLGGFEAADAGTAKARITNYRGAAVVDGAGVGTVFSVIQVNPTATPCGAVAAPCLQLRADAAGTGSFLSGDSIVKTSAPGGAEAFPQTVQYGVAACPAPLAGQCLMRTTVPAAAAGPSVIATNVSDLQFRYLLDGTLEVDAPTAVQMDDVRAVRVTISGQIVDTAAAAGGDVKLRTLMSIVAIRNS